MEIYDDVARQYAEFATYAHDSSPCLQDWALRVSRDTEVCAWIASLPRAKRQPNLVFAAARWHGVPAPGPYAGFRGALLGDDGRLRATVLERATQTNEAGRMASLLPALTRVASDRPVALLEVGASAGLCLYPDRWGYEWTTPQGPVTLGPRPYLPCDVTGPAPLPTALPTITWRGGIDLHPLDVHDDDAVAWLETLVWPEQDARRTVLRHGIALARAEPSRLVAGDLLDELAALVAEASKAGTVVVFHSAVIAYLTPADRRRFAAMMADLVASGTCHWISNETPNVLPDLKGLPPEAAEHTGGQHFVLGIDGRAVAWAHQHGRSLSWFG